MYIYKGHAGFCPSAVPPCSDASFLCNAQKAVKDEVKMEDVKMEDAVKEERLEP